MIEDMERPLGLGNMLLFIFQWLVSYYARWQQEAILLASEFQGDLSVQPGTHKGMPLQPSG
ncbi:MAG: hypothetical protein OEM02_10590 [Desulfobulbaceae bacterium]|nr:hypothetical protein [Desulfobulbaceae bacterium]